MELNQTTTRTIHNVEAEQNGWKLTATVTVQDAKVIEIRGKAHIGEFKEDSITNNVSSFFGKIEDGALRVTYSFKYDDADVYGILKTMVDAIIAKYE